MSNVTHAIQAQLCALPSPIPLAATLCYTSADPWAVTLKLESGTEQPNVWVTSRELLTDAMLWPVGEGAVQFKRVDTSYLIVTLTAQGSSADIILGSDRVLRFLDATYQLVPSGTEQDHMDVDTELTALGLRSTGEQNA